MVFVIGSLRKLKPPQTFFRSQCNWVQHAAAEVLNLPLPQPGFFSIKKPMLTTQRHGTSSAGSGYIDPTWKAFNPVILHGLNARTENYSAETLHLPFEKNYKKHRISMYLHIFQRTRILNALSFSWRCKFLIGK